MSEGTATCYCEDDLSVGMSRELSGAKCEGRFPEKSLGRNLPGDVRIPMKDYKSVRVAVMIAATMVKVKVKVKVKVNVYLYSASS